jgi:hypothetical protein
MAHFLDMRERNGFFTALFCASLLISTWPTHAATENVFSANPASHVISDDQSGVALFGYDPVAYHTDNKAVEGSAEFQVLHKTLVWRFKSLANLEAFQADPAAYIPLFGGHDPFAVSQGLMTVSDPRNFMIFEGRLAMFRSQENHDHFKATNDIYKTALSRWPTVVRQHASH